MQSQWKLLILVVFLCRPGSAQELCRYEFSAPKMGTSFRLVFYAPDSLRAVVAAERAFERVDELNAMMSDYDPDSELSRLSARAAESGADFYPVSPDLWRVLRLARRISRRSDGAFDATIGPLSRLWRRAFRRREFPDPADLETARSLVNYRWLKLRTRDQSVRLKKAGMRLDLGGIAKGYAVDAVYEMLENEGYERALVDGGGDIYAGEAPPGQTGWRIAQKTLRQGEMVDELIWLKNGAVAASGDTYRFLEWEGKRYSHLIDPRTGLGVTGRRHTTVRAASCTLADALASTLSVVALDRTKKLARQFAVSFRIIEQAENGVWRQIDYAPAPE